MDVAIDGESFILCAMEYGVRFVTFAHPVNIQSSYRCFLSFQYYSDFTVKGLNKHLGPVKGVQNSQ